MDYYVLTLFPDMIRDAANTSIMGRAVKNGLISVHTINISDYSRLPFIVDSVNVGSNITFTGIKKDKMERLIFIVK